MKLAEIFRDGMVLQHGKPIRIFGEGCGHIRVDFLGEISEVEADGKWCTEFSPRPYGGPYLLKVSCGTEYVTVCDVMIGEVILFSGQSNIQFRMASEVTPRDAYTADNLLRIFVSERPEAGEPLTPVDGWVCAHPDSIDKWSAAAYLTGAAMRRDPAYESIAIGVIACSQGASAIQPWIDNRLFVGEAKAFDNHVNSQTCYTWNDPGFLYHFMLERLLPYSVNSVVWYQGESNARLPEAENYAAMFDLMLADWRKAFRDASLPFIVIQLPDYQNGDPTAWPMIQAMQSDAPNRNENVYVVISADICESDDIHPPTKWKLADRVCEKIKEIRNV